MLWFPLVHFSPGRSWVQVTRTHRSYALALNTVGKGRALGGKEPGRGGRAGADDLLRSLAGCSGPWRRGTEGWRAGKRGGLRWPRSEEGAALPPVCLRLQAAWGLHPCHLLHCHSASPSSLAVFMDQVLGHTLRIHPPVLRSQVLAGHRQKTCTFHERTPCAGPSCSVNLEGCGGKVGKGGGDGREACLAQVGLPRGVESTGLPAMLLFPCSINPHLVRRSPSWAGWCSCPTTLSTRTYSS